MNQPDEPRPPLTPPRRFLLAAAAVCGFAEATVFFIVPDVLVTAATVRGGLRAGLAAAVAAASGAVVGGLAVALAAAAAPDAVRAGLALVPAITPAMVDRAFAAFATEGLPAMAAGSFGGVPFKIYAAAAGETGAALLPFAAAAFAIRLSRFVLAALAVAALRRLLRVSDRTAAVLLAVFWTGFYAWYFSVAG